MLDGGGAVRGINAGQREMPRSELDGLISRAQELGAKGLVWAFREGDGWRSPTAKFLSEAELADAQRAARRRGGRPAAARRRQAPRSPTRCSGSCGSTSAERFGLIAEGERPPALDRRLAADGVERGGAALGPAAPSRSPRRPASSTPTIPGAARALAYDVVWNGQEMGGGSIRIQRRRGPAGRSSPRSGSTPRTAEARFGFLLEALRYGAPPHGGIAYGLDRIVQRLAGADTIRDVIAFPKTASGSDLLTGAPAPVDEPQLRELGVAHRTKRNPPGTEHGPRRGSGLSSQVAPAPGPGQTPVHVDDPSFDSWEVVRDFADVRTARAWHQALDEAGIEAVLTADWPLDRFGRGDIALRSRPRLERGRAAALQPRRRLTRLTRHAAGVRGGTVAPEARARSRAVSPFDPTQTARELIVSRSLGIARRHPPFTSRDQSQRR